jgi:hypothetical protein
MHVATQFSVFLINKPGVLASVTGALASAGVNLGALALMDSGEHGALRIVCDDPEKTRAVLTKTHDRWTETQVLVTELGNRPGSFAAVARALTDAGINVTYAYFSAEPHGGTTTTVLKVADLDKALKVLQAAEAAQPKTA